MERTIKCIRIKPFDSHSHWGHSIPFITHHRALVVLMNNEHCFWIVLQHFCVIPLTYPGHIGYLNPKESSLRTVQQNLPILKDYNTHEHHVPQIRDSSGPILDQVRGVRGPGPGAALQGAQL